MGQKGLSRGRGGRWRRIGVEMRIGRGTRSAVEHGAGTDVTRNNNDQRPPLESASMATCRSRAVVATRLEVEDTLTAVRMTTTTRGRR